MTKYAFEPGEIIALSGLFARLRERKKPGLLPLATLPDNPRTEDLLGPLFVLGADGVLELLEQRDDNAEALLVAKFIVANAHRLHPSLHTLFQPAAEIVLNRLAKLEALTRGPLEVAPYAAAQNST